MQNGLKRFIAWGERELERVEQGDGRALAQCAAVNLVAICVLAVLAVGVLAWCLR